MRKDEKRKDEKRETDEKTKREERTILRLKHTITNMKTIIIIPSGK